MGTATATPETKPVRGTILHVSGYMAGQVGLLLLGFATFPIFTRLMSRADYGTLSLINTTLSLLLLVVGMGLPNAVVRFFPEYSKGDRAGFLRFNTTQLGGSIFFATVGSTLLVAGSFLIHAGPERASLIVGFRYIAFVLVSRAALNILLEFFRVGRRVSLYNALILTQRLGTAVGAVAGFLLFRSLNGMLAGIFAGETIVALVGAAMAYRSRYFLLTSPDLDQLRMSVKFAAPLMLASLAGSVMAYADRYLIEGYLGPEAVATYAVAYDICGYIQVLLLTSFRLAVLPEIVSRYTDLGAEAASEYLSRAFRYVGWLVIGAGFGFVAIGSQAITILASNKYADAGALLPYLVPGIMLGGLDFVFATGLYLQKRNDLWFYVALLAVLLNIGLNVVMIPAFGIKGAAAATLLSYVAQEVAVYFVSNRFVKLRLDIGSLLRATVSAAIMFLIITRIHFLPGGIAGLLMTAVLGALVFGVLHLAMEKHSRQLLWGQRS